MRYIEAIALAGFGFQAYLGIFTLVVACSKAAEGWQQGPRSFALELMAGAILFGTLNLIPAIAVWTARKRKQPGAWPLVASLMDIAWAPRVANCTPYGGGFLLMAAICGLIAFPPPILILALARLKLRLIPPTCSRPASSVSGNPYPAAQQ